MMHPRSPFRRGRTAVFAAITLGIPLVACNLLKQKETADDAGAAATATAAVATATAAPTETATAVTPPLGTATAPAATATGTAKKVAVKLPDGGTAVVDATVSPDGAVQLPTGFQFPTLPGFDASALKVPAFDAAAIPIPTLPSGFPQIPGFGVDSGKK